MKTYKFESYILIDAENEDEAVLQMEQINADEGPVTPEWTLTEVSEADEDEAQFCPADDTMLRAIGNDIYAYTCVDCGVSYELDDGELVVFDEDAS